MEPAQLQVRWIFFTNFKTVIAKGWSTQRNTHSIAAFLLFFLFLGCSTKPHELNRVRVEYWQQYGMVGFAYKITIQGNGSVRYEGHRSVGVPGVQEYVVPRQTVETIVTLLRDAGFFSMPENLPT